jgi:hypothetical protein
VLIRTTNQASCIPVATSTSAASSSTRFGLWKSASEGPNRCSLWNCAAATIRSPPTTVETRIIAVMADEVSYSVAPIAAKTSPVAVVAARVRRKRRGPASSLRRLTMPSVPRGASAYPTFTSATTRVTSAYSAGGRTRAMIRFAAAKPAPAAP